MYRLWGLVAFFIRKFRVSVKAPFFNFLWHINYFCAGGAGIFSGLLGSLLHNGFLIPPCQNVLTITPLLNSLFLRFFRFLLSKNSGCSISAAVSARNDLKAYLPKIKGASFGAFKLLEKLNFIFFQCPQRACATKISPKENHSRNNFRQGRVPFGAFCYFNVS